MIDTVNLLAEIEVLKRRLENAVEVVRCKECKHKDEIVNYCYENDRDVNSDDYCSYGERSE